MEIIFGPHSLGEHIVSISTFSTDIPMERAFVECDSCHYQQIVRRGGLSMDYCLGEMLVSECRTVVEPDGIEENDDISQSDDVKKLGEYS